MDVVIEGSEDFKKRYDSVREWLRQNDCDQLLVSIEKDHSVMVTIVESNYSSEVSKRYSTNNHLTKAILNWNPNNFLLNEDESVMMSPAVILMHEMKHISEMITDYSSFQDDNKENVKGVKKTEDRAILFESFISGKLGEISKGSITRYSYGAVLYSNKIPEYLSAKNQSAFTSRYNDGNKLPQLKHQALLNAILKAENSLR